MRCALHCFYCSYLSLHKNDTLVSLLLDMIIERTNHDDVHEFRLFGPEDPHILLQEGEFFVLSFDTFVLLMCFASLVLRYQDRVDRAVILTVRTEARYEQVFLYGPSLRWEAETSRSGILRDHWCLT